MVWKGALAGLAASVPMAVVMAVLYRLLPRSERYALPPEQITTKTAVKAGQEELVQNGPNRRITTWLAHLGYGAATGSTFSLLTRKLPTPPLLRGILFGTFVWSASYLGWIPSAGILPPAAEVPGSRNLLMIAAHWVWGGLTGIFVDEMES